MFGFFLLIRYFIVQLVVKVLLFFGFFIPLHYKIIFTTKKKGNSEEKLKNEGGNPKK